MKFSGPPPAFSRTARAWQAARRTVHALIVITAVFLLLGAGDDSTRFKDLGHRMMCVCGCGQILLECNHIGCTYSDKMRGQLLAAIDKGNGNDDLLLQGFVQEYGPAVIAAPTATGLNRLAWIMPFAVLGFGISFVIYVARSWRNRPAPALADGMATANGRELVALREQARRETDL
jgi:cytochrome c-type biogenesis protein CcmH